MSAPESFDEQIARLELLAEGSVRTVIRDEDRAAIRALLQAYGRLAMEVERAER